MARSVGQCAEMMRVLADGLEVDALDSLDGLAAGIAWLDRADSLVHARVRETAELFPGSREVEFPLAEKIGPAFMREVADVHRDLFAEFADSYGDNVRTKVESCLELSDAEHQSGLRARDELHNRAEAAMDGLDLLLTPTLAFVAPKLPVDDLEIRADTIRFTYPVQRPRVAGARAPLRPGRGRRRRVAPDRGPSGLRCACPRGRRNGRVPPSRELDLARSAENLLGHASSCPRCGPLCLARAPRGRADGFRESAEGPERPEGLPPPGQRAGLALQPQFPAHACLCLARGQGREALRVPGLHEPELLRQRTRLRGRHGRHQADEPDRDRPRLPALDDRQPVRAVRTGSRDRPARCGGSLERGLRVQHALARPAEPPRPAVPGPCPLDADRRRHVLRSLARRLEQALLHDDERRRRARVLRVPHAALVDPVRPVARPRRSKPVRRDPDGHAP